MNTYTNEFGAPMAAHAALDTLIIQFQFKDAATIAFLRKECDKLVRVAIARRTIRQLRNPTKAVMPDRISTEAHWYVRLFYLALDNSTYDNVGFLFEDKG